MVRGPDAGAVVADAERDLTARDRQVHMGLAGLGVLGDVVEGFLRHAVQAGGTVGIQVGQIARRIVCRDVAGDFGATREVDRERVQRLQQAELLQRPRAEIVDDPSRRDDRARRRLVGLGQQAWRREGSSTAARLARRSWIPIIASIWARSSCSSRAIRLRSSS